jgi:ABC-type antimicrobial peptide transport system permease subunit
MVRASGPLGPLMNRAKAAIGAMSSSIGIEFRPFSDQLKESVLPEKPMATLSGAFGFLAALLATLGLYGVIAYMVARRRNEIREAILLLGIGLLAGVVLAWWAGTAAATLLFGLPPHDAVSLVAAATLLTLIALIASYVRARRAAWLDPIAALRNE